MRTGKGQFDLTIIDTLRNYGYLFPHATLTHLST
jgi:hypothetical protein